MSTGKLDTFLSKSVVEFDILSGVYLSLINSSFVTNSFDLLERNSSYTFSFLRSLVKFRYDVITSSGFVKSVLLQESKVVSPKMPTVNVILFIMMFLVCRPTIAYNVLQLGVVADFSHKSSIEELHLSLPLNCHTKHGTRHYAKLLLALRPSFLSCLLMSFRVCLGMLAWWLFCCFLHGFVRLEKLQMCHQMRWLMLNYILFLSLCHFEF